MCDGAPTLQFFVNNNARAHFECCLKVHDVEQTGEKRNGRPHPTEDTTPPAVRTIFTALDNLLYDQARGFRKARPP